MSRDPWHGLRSRQPVEADHPRILAAAETWWGAVGGPTGAQQRAALLPRLFVQHFADTSVVLEDVDGELAGFLLGFMSQSQPTVAYVHFVGVAPSLRRSGAATALYQWFSDQVRGRGAVELRCITSPGNSDSIAFHAGIGFAVVSGGGFDGGVSVHRDYDGPGVDRVVFSRAVV